MTLSFSLMQKLARFQTYLLKVSFEKAMLSKLQLTVLLSKFMVNTFLGIEDVGEEVSLEVEVLEMVCLNF